MLCEDEIIRWSKSAPTGINLWFSRGPEAVCRSLMKQPLAELVAVLLRCQRRRAKGDRDPDALWWMERLVRTILSRHPSHLIMQQSEFIPFETSKLAPCTHAPSTHATVCSCANSRLIHMPHALGSLDCTELDDFIATGIAHPLSERLANPDGAKLRRLTYSQQEGNAAGLLFWLILDRQRKNRYTTRCGAHIPKAAWEP